MKLNFCFPKIAIHTLLLMVTGLAFAAPPTQWTPKGAGGGGALFAPSFNPFNSAELYLACDMSEVFRSTNFGGAWAPVNFKQIQGGRQSIIQYTSNSSVLYAIDYTSIGGADSMTPTRSTDGGTTWQRLANDPTGGGAYALFVDPASTNRLLVSDYSNVYYSSNAGSTFNPKFTAGAGCFVAGAFFDGANIFVGTGSGLLVSTNGGATFALSGVGGIPAGQAMFSFAGAKQGGVTRLFCITLDAADVYPGLFIEGSYGSYGGVYALDWGQPNWAAKVTGIVAGHQPVFVAMAQNDISTAYIAGQQSTIDYPVLYKTANGGASWQAVLQITNNQDVFSGWGGAPNGLGGLYKTTNRGVSWTRLNSLDRVTSCAINPLNPNELYLTTETDGLWITTNLNSVTPSFAQVTSYPFRQPERVFFNPYKPSEMWVTSFGNGIRVGSTVSLPGILSLNGATLHQDGTARLTFQQATPGAPYAILGSTNLTNWFPLGTNTAGANGLLQFNDTNAGGLSKRFYRSQAL